MKVYVATAFLDKHLARAWMGKLREAGIEITHDWTVVESPPGGETTMSLSEQAMHAAGDLRGVRLADIVWVLAPETGGTGCWIEMGYGIGLTKCVIVSGSRRTIFTTQATEYFATHEEAFKAIRDYCE